MERLGEMRHMWSTGDCSERESGRKSIQADYEKNWN